MIKTVSLTADTETKVEISGGYNVGVINRTTGMLYASRKSGISAGADDVAAIPAGDSYVIRAADDTVYLLATAAGDVQLESIGVTEVFRIAAARSSSGGGEGGTVDEVARQAISSHANNDEIHLTTEKAIKAAATTISNPNLLINPDFKINQRGQEEYDAVGGYCVDCWGIAGDELTKDKLVIHSDHVTFQRYMNTGNSLQQLIENPERFAGKTITLSALTGGSDDYSLRIRYNDTRETSAHSLVNGVSTFTMTLPENLTLLAVCLQCRTTGAEVDVYWMKLEIGSVATPFTPPDHATELAKCQRYYQIHTTGDIDPINLRPTMATIKDIKERSNGNYEYIAEL